MLYYDIIDISEGIDPTKSSKSKECTIYHYCFFNHGFGFEDYLWNSCHDLTILCFNISDIAITIVKNVDHRRIIHNINKPEATKLLKNSVLEDDNYIQKILP